MPTVISTPGAVDANSYASTAEADAYHSTRLHSEVWDAAIAADKEKAVIMATRTLDAMYEWANSPSTATQALQWPRLSMPRRGGMSFVGDTEVPPELKNATAELARQLIAEDRTADSDVETQGIEAFSAGPVSFRFREGVEAKVVPDSVQWLLPSEWGYVRGTGRPWRELVRA